MTELKPVETNPNGLAVETLEIPGRGTYKFRELAVDENDACREGATNKEGVFNGRTMIRMMIVASAVEPKITMAELGKLPQRVYAKIVNFVNDLNDEMSLDQKEDPGNS